GDNAMERDGLETVWGDIESKRWWLYQMLRLVPPSFWCQEWNVQPADLVQIAYRNEDWKDDLLGGWARATVRHSDRDWAEALLSARSTLPSAKRINMGELTANGFIAMLQFRHDMLEALNEC
ncbi:MAG: hypothetical protein NZT92_05785, partial [Abditibacteriales bacterium]|nr:hypothetical protein [Abditibacteriales bacterium]